MKTCYSINIRAVEFEANITKDDAQAYIDVQFFGRDGTPDRNLKVEMKHGDEQTIFVLTTFIQKHKDDVSWALIREIEQHFTIKG